MKAPLQRCFSFVTKLEAGDDITTGQYMNLQTFSDLQFSPVRKTCFHSIHNALKETVSGDLLEYVAPEVAEIAMGRKNFTTAAKNVGNNWVVVAEKGVKAEFFPENLQKNQLRAKRDFIKNVSQ